MLLSYIIYVIGHFLLYFLFFVVTPILVIYFVEYILSDLFKFILSRFGVWDSLVEWRQQIDIKVEANRRKVKKEVKTS
jgi:hypothetical protein